MHITRTTDIFLVKLCDKGIDSEGTRIFLRTERKFFDITRCHPKITQHIDGCDGLLLNAHQVLAEYVADLLYSDDMGTTN